MRLGRRASSPQRGASVTGLLYGGGVHHGTFVVLKITSLITPLRMDDKILKVDDHAIYGEEACGLLEEEN